MSSSSLAQTRDGTLGLIFMHSLGPERTLYSIEFFPLHSLIDRRVYLCPLDPPKPKLEWAHPRDPSFCYMNFHRSSTYPETVYAVGGLTYEDAIRFNISSITTLPKDLFSFPLSPLATEGDLISSKQPSVMKGSKFLPHVVEIEGLLYVLSGPRPWLNSRFPEIEYAFEVYNPKHDTWEQLENPPFMRTRDDDHASVIYPSCFGTERSYSYVVIGPKLFLSDGVLSCVYDTRIRKWNECHLFSEKFYNSLGEGAIFRMFDRNSWEKLKRCNQLKGCGPGFPFLKKAIHFKDGVFLCMMPKNPIAPLAAFKVTYSDDDVETGVEIVDIDYAGGLPVETIGLCASELVDLGNDCFAMVFTYNSFDDDQNVSIVTFKISFGYHGETGKRALRTLNAKIGYRSDISDYCNLIYSFTLTNSSQHEGRSPRSTLDMHEGFISSDQSSKELSATPRIGRSERSSASEGHGITPRTGRSETSSASEGHGITRSPRRSVPEIIHEDDDVPKVHKEATCSDQDVIVQTPSRKTLFSFVEEERLLDEEMAQISVKKKRFPSMVRKLKSEKQPTLKKKSGNIWKKLFG